MPQYQTAEFLRSVATLDQLPPDQGIEIAFVGRSNAGKSSVLNRLTQNKNLARVSKTPGRTQHINLFALDAKRRIADLPGYGYAKVPPTMKQHWQNILETYLRKRQCLKGLILVMDIRHPLREFDQHLLSWSHHRQLPVHILLNKSDKLSTNAIKQAERYLSDNLTSYSNTITFQPFSAFNGVGIKTLRAVLDRWFAS